MVEILAPAGNVDSFYSAIYGGANAVYLGLDMFSARKNAENFTMDNLPYYINYAHILGVKVYVALNTIVSDKELPLFFKYVKFCNDNMVDGIIVQDMFLGRIIKDMFPKLPLHLSTQGGVNNIYGAKIAKEMGFSRVVLSRETSEKDIIEISRFMETEVFIQGALCTAFSGQCYLSSFAGNNSGNRGLCKQPCRKLYTVKNSKTHKNGYLISLSDLSLRHKIIDYKNAGVVSFKIEGRMRKPSYVYYACKYYCDILDGKNPSISPLSRSFNRGNYTYGLGFGQDKTLISSSVQSHIGEVIGTVSKVNDGKLLITTNHVFKYGDSGKILRNLKEVANYTVDKNLNVVFQGSVRVSDKVTITTDSFLEGDYLNHKKLLPCKVYGEFLSGKHAKLTANASNRYIEVISDFVLDKAINQPTTKEQLIESLSKVGDLPFSVTIEINTDSVFIPKSLLNNLRRSLYEKLATEFSGNRDTTYNPINIPLPVTNDNKTLLIIDEDFSSISNYNFDYAVFSPKDYSDKKSFEDFFNDLKCSTAKRYLYLPGWFSNKDNGLIAPLLKDFDGVYVDGYYGAYLFNSLKIPCILGSGVNIYNKASAFVAQKYCDDFVISKEATINQAKDFNSGLYYSAGSIKVMDLCYCPFEKSCYDCKGDDYSILSDGTRDFILRRVKLNDCRFELYNCATLLTDGFKRQVFNFIGLSKQQKQIIMDNVNCPKNAKDGFSTYTTGHSLKGLI